MKPWKSPHPVGSRGPRSRFNGATAMKPWKSQPPWQSVNPRRSFNGATAMKPWKREMERRRIANSRSFNGATAMKPWKSVTDLLGSYTATWLQWGHGDEAVEEEPGWRGRAVGVLASMGPRR